jgi:diaminopimelate decarboxylase
LSKRGPIPTELLPATAAIDGAGRLSVGGVDLVELAEEFGTPLFVYDEADIVMRCRAALSSFPGGVYYASKAFLCKHVARLVTGEGLGLDVATGGELAVAQAAGIGGNRLTLHGNNKSEAELVQAIAYGVDRIVVDDGSEVPRIAATAAALSPGRRQKVLVRVTPGVMVDTHRFVMTGQADSKFGVEIASGAAERVIQAILSEPHLSLVGLHFHLGSQIFDLSAFEVAVSVVAPLLERYEIGELSIGGGLGVAYVEGEVGASFEELAARVNAALKANGLQDVSVTIEPGRSIVARAGITLYRVGVIKELSTGTRYVAVDGGMSDNPRPVLYGSGYEVFAPGAAASDRDVPVRLVGKHCESGDVVVEDGALPTGIGPGDVVATPVTGAYGYSMASNYNKVPRPAVVFVRDGKARLVLRRETYDDLMRLEV